MTQSRAVEVTIH